MVESNIRRSNKETPTMKTEAISEYFTLSNNSANDVRINSFNAITLTRTSSSLTSDLQTYNTS